MIEFGDEYFTCSYELQGTETSFLSKGVWRVEGSIMMELRVNESAKIFQSCSNNVSDTGHQT